MKGRDAKADFTFLFTLGLICIKLWDLRSTCLPADEMVAEGKTRTLLTVQEIQGERLLGSAAVSLPCQPCKLSDSVGEGLGEIGPLENMGLFRSV